MITKLYSHLLIMLMKLIKRNSRLPIIAIVKEDVVLEGGNGLYQGIPLSPQKKRVYSGRERLIVYEPYINDINELRIAINEAYGKEKDIYEYSVDELRNMYEKIEWYDAILVKIISPEGIVFHLR